MTEAIIVAVISGLCTLAGSWAGIRQFNKLVDFRLSRLEDKVDKHNCLVERMALVEASAKSAHHRLDEFADKL